MQLSQAHLAGQIGYLELDLQGREGGREGGKTRTHTQHSVVCTGRLIVVRVYNIVHVPNTGYYTGYYTQPCSG